MPRSVDHQSRRAEVVAALWRVVRRSGIHVVSVRSVAAEAGMAPSVMRHYFASQDDLLAFALQSVVERVTLRLQRDGEGRRGADGARFVLDQFLPLDPDRRAETEVYLAFIGRAHADPRLRAIRDQTDSDTRRVILAALDMLADDDCLHPRRQPQQEADRLYALLDGLAMHGALMPDRYPPEALDAVLAAHLRELASAPADPP